MGDSKAPFTVMEDEKLVEIVARHPSLYDLQSPVYKDQVVKDNAWKEVSEHLGRSDQDCRKRWRNIRDTHNKRKKKGKSTGSSASSKSQKWALAEMLHFLDKVEHKRPSMSNIGRGSANINDIDDSGNIKYEDHDDINGSVYVVQESSEHSVLSSGTSPDGTSDTASPVEKKVLMPSAGFSRPPTKRERFNDKILKLMEDRSSERKEILRRLSQRQEDSVDLFFRSLAMSVKKLRPELISVAKRRALNLVLELENQNTVPYVHTATETASYSGSSYPCTPSPDPRCDSSFVNQVIVMDTCSFDSFGTIPNSIV